MDPATNPDMLVSEKVGGGRYPQEPEAPYSFNEMEEIQRKSF